MVGCRVKREMTFYSVCVCLSVEICKMNASSSFFAKKFYGVFIFFIAKKKKKNVFLVGRSQVGYLYFVFICAITIVTKKCFFLQIRLTFYVVFNGKTKNKTKYFFFQTVLSVQFVRWVSGSAPVLARSRFFSLLTTTTQLRVQSYLPKHSIVLLLSTVISFFLFLLFFFISFSFCFSSPFFFFCLFLVSCILQEVWPGRTPTPLLLFAVFFFLHFRYFPPSPRRSNRLAPEGVFFFSATVP